MTLSDKACEELTAFVVQLADFLPAPARRMMIAVPDSFILAAIIRDRDRLEKQVLEPLHGWLHEHHIDVFVPIKEAKGNAQV